MENLQRTKGGVHILQKGRAMKQKALSVEEKCPHDEELEPREILITTYV